jgi:hypothetical protein
MLSEHARLYEALEKLDKLAPNDERVQIALAVARVRRFAAQGNAALADAARTKARLLLEQKLAQEPENRTWAVELADLLVQIGDQAACDTLVERHPEAAAAVGDLYVAAGRTREAVP